MYTGTEMKRTTGADGSIHEVWVKNLHVRSTSACIRTLEAGGFSMRQETSNRVSYSVVDPRRVGGSDILVDAGELDIGHELGRVRSGLVVVQESVVFRFSVCIAIRTWSAYRSESVVRSCTAMESPATL